MLSSQGQLAPPPAPCAGSAPPPRRCRSPPRRAFPSSHLFLVRSHVEVQEKRREKGTRQVSLFCEEKGTRREPVCFFFHASQQPRRRRIGARDGGEREAPCLPPQRRLVARAGPSLSLSMVSGVYFNVSAGQLVCKKWYGKWAGPCELTSSCVPPLSDGTSPVPRAMLDAKSQNSLSYSSKICAARGASKGQWIQPNS